MQQAVLLIIDVQKAMDDLKWGKRNNPYAEETMGKLLAHWRHIGWPVIHVKDCSPDPTSPFRKGQPLHDFKAIVKPIGGETIIEKSTGNAFVGTNLDTTLKELGIKKLVIVGIHTQYCVDTVVRMASCLGYDVSLVADATVATEVTDKTGKIWPAPDVQNYTLALLSGYANIITSQSLLR